MTRLASPAVLTFSAAMLAACGVNDPIHPDTRPSGGDELVEACASDTPAGAPSARTVDACRHEVGPDPTWASAQLACNGYAYDAAVLFTIARGDEDGLRLGVFDVELRQYNLARTKVVRGLDYEVQLGDDTGTWVATPFQVSPDWAVTPAGLDGLRPAVDARPFVRVIAGHDGDGLAACSFRIYPCNAP